MKTKIAVLVAVMLWTSLSAQEQKPLSFDDLIAMKRLDEAILSPDGRWILYNVKEYSLATNSYSSRLSLLSVDGANKKSLTSSSFKDLNPTWSPDGRQVAFVSNRDGSYQVYIMAVDGGEPRRVTNLSTGVSPNGLQWSGNLIAFTSDVFSDCPDDACNEQRNEDRAQSKVRAQIFERLPYRVWDSWKDGKRSQLFTVEVTSGVVKDLIEGDFDVPPVDLGGRRDFCFSPDGRQMAFTMNTNANVAWSTNNDIFLMPSEGGAARRISTSPGVDNQPLFSPDGRYLAFRSMKRAGYEADKTDVMIYDLASGKLSNLTQSLDRSVGNFVWNGPLEIYFDGDHDGYRAIHRIDLATGAITRVSEKLHDDLVGVTGERVILKRQTIRQPTELYALDLKSMKASPLTALNEDRLSRIVMNDLEEFWFEGAAKVKVQGFLLKPPNFNPKRKYPLVYLVHGGPQGAWGDDFHYRWNAEMFAAPGFVVVMVNPRGSTGYGQRFTDDINLDWGGKAYEDLMKGLDYVLATYTFIDKNRVGAAGASYGGYMMNWFNGHTDRFKCLVTHSGIMNKFNMYGGTEELWFEEWEMGGPYWEGKNKSTYEKWSPHNYVQNFKTPTLVLHGEFDFRVPVMEGMHLFTVLQRKGIPSRFVYFPDEGHWIVKPQNAQLWWSEVLNWLDHWLVPHE